MKKLNKILLLLFIIWSSMSYAQINNEIIIKGTAVNLLFYGKKDQPEKLIAMVISQHNTIYYIENLKSWDDFTSEKIVIVTGILTESYPEKEQNKIWKQDVDLPLNSDGSLKIIKEAKWELYIRYGHKLELLPLLGQIKT